MFDSIDVLLTLMNDPLSERQEIYRLHEWLNRTGLTGIITTRGDPLTSPDTQRFGFIQYTTDCTVQLATRDDGACGPARAPRLEIPRL